MRSFPTPEEHGGYVHATGDCRLMYSLKYPQKPEPTLSLVISHRFGATERTPVTVKSLATGAAGVGAPAAGVMCRTKNQAWPNRAG